MNDSNQNSILQQNTDQPINIPTDNRQSNQTSAEPTNFSPLSPDDSTNINANPQPPISQSTNKSSFANAQTSNFTPQMQQTEPTNLTRAPNSIPQSGVFENTNTNQKADDGSVTTTPSVEPEEKIQNVLTEPPDHVPVKYGGKKVIATIFGILLLMGGVAAGVLLVQRQQQITQKAAITKVCSESADCILLDDPGTSGTYTAPQIIDFINITSNETFRFESPGGSNECYKIEITDNRLSWETVGRNCNEISFIQVWLKKFNPPSNPDIYQQKTDNNKDYCGEISAYDTNWKLLTLDKLKKLKPGDVVRFTVPVLKDSENVDQARFSINDTLHKAITNKRPGFDEFYTEYTIPRETEDFLIKAEVHHTNLGWIP